MTISFITVHVDRAINAKRVRAAGWIWAGGPEGARNVLATIAGSTITVAGVVFSITIVSLTLASSQFSPRLLRNFMADRATQFVLGVFVSTFLYCLLVLRTIRDSDAATTFERFLSVNCGLIFAVISVGFLIFFIHHVSKTILANNLIARVALELREGTDRLFPDSLGEEEDESSRKVESLVAVNGSLIPGESVAVTIRLRDVLDCFAAEIPSRARREVLAGHSQMVCDDGVKNAGHESDCQKIARSFKTAEKNFRRERISASS